MKDFVTEFKKEDVEQKKQVDELRVKYVTKVILFELNDKRGDMIKEAEEYEKLPAELKEKLKREAFDKISKNVTQMIALF